MAESGIKHNKSINQSKPSTGSQSHTRVIWVCLVEVLWPVFATQKSDKIPQNMDFINIHNHPQILMNVKFLSFKFFIMCLYKKKSKFNLYQLLSIGW
jgi:hypothetical protein